MFIFFKSPLTRTSSLEERRMLGQDTVALSFVIIILFVKECNSHVTSAYNIILSVIQWKSESQHVVLVIAYCNVNRETDQKNKFRFNKIKCVSHCCHTDHHNWINYNYLYYQQSTKIILRSELQQRNLQFLRTVFVVRTKLPSLYCTIFKLLWTAAV